MFEQSRGAPPTPLANATDDAPGEGAEAVDPREYRPWILQRGRSRPAMMLELRRYEPRSGLWQGWIMSYPSLHAVEYMGDRMLSLDFGARQFIVEGRGLAELIPHLQQGSAVAIHEYSSAVWPEPTGPVIMSIRKPGTGAQT